MANSYAGNVIKVDTTANFVYAENVENIKFIPVADGSCTIRKATAAGDNSGATLWTHTAGDGDPSPLEPVFETPCIRSPGGVHVTVSASSVVYLYLK